MYVHVHTCYVLIRPPIPYITSSRCKRLNKFCPIEILLHKRTNPRVPPCKHLKKYVLKMYDVKHFIIFLKKNHFIEPLKNAFLKFMM